jgi:hypothetical protein
MANRKYEFDAIIHKNEKVNAGYIDFPYDVKKEFGGKSRVKVKAFVDGFLYRGSLVKMGGECHMLGITQEVRLATGRNPGDMIHVVLEEDTDERVVDIPEDLMVLLRDEPSLAEYFNGLSYTHKKEYVKWINEAKKEETRKNRLLKTVEMLRSRRKTPL